MRRRVLTIVAGVSTLLFMIVTAMFITSEVAYAEWQWQYSAGNYYYLQIGRSNLEIGGRVMDPGAKDQKVEGFTFISHAPAVGVSPFGFPKGASHFRFLGVEAYKNHFFGFCRLAQIIISFWILFPLTAAFPAYFNFFQRATVIQKRRRKMGLCPKCGYDMRAVPNRCSECGNVLPTTL